MLKTVTIYLKGRNKNNIPKKNNKIFHFSSSFSWFEKFETLDQICDQFYIRLENRSVLDQMKLSGNEFQFKKWRRINFSCSTTSLNERIDAIRIE